MSSDRPVRKKKMVEIVVPEIEHSVRKRKAVEIVVPEIERPQKRAPRMTARASVSSVTAFQLFLAQGHFTSLHALLADYDANTRPAWEAARAVVQTVYLTAVEPLKNARTRTYLISAPQLMRMDAIEADPKRLAEAKRAWRRLAVADRQQFEHRALG